MEYMRPLHLYQYMKRNTLTPRMLLGMLICNNKIVVYLISNHNPNNWTPSLLGEFPIDSSMDSIAKTMGEWITKHSIGGLVIGCGCDHFGIPKPEAFHVVRFVQELSKEGELQGLLYTYWKLKAVNEMIRRCCDFSESDKYNVISETFGARRLVVDYIDTMVNYGSQYRPSRSCSQVLKEFTNDCTSWGDFLDDKYKMPIMMVYTPWHYYWEDLGWMNLLELPLHPRLSYSLKEITADYKEIWLKHPRIYSVLLDRAAEYKEILLKTLLEDPWKMKSCSLVRCLIQNEANDQLI